MGGRWGVALGPSRHRWLFGDRKTPTETTPARAVFHIRRRPLPNSPNARMVAASWREDVIHRAGFAMGEWLRGELLSSCSGTSCWHEKRSTRFSRPRCSLSGGCSTTTLCGRTVPLGIFSVERRGLLADFGFLGGNTFVGHDLHVIGFLNEDFWRAFRRTLGERAKRAPANHDLRRAGQEREGELRQHKKECAHVCAVKSRRHQQQHARTAETKPNTRNRAKRCESPQPAANHTSGRRGTRTPNPLGVNEVL